MSKTNGLMNMTSEIETEFEDLKRRIKEHRLSVSLDRSLIEDQVMPETYCDSSPDLEMKYRRLFSKNAASLLREEETATPPDSPTWQEKISDESFVRIERLVEELNESVETILQLESSRHSDNSRQSEKFKGNESHDDHKESTEDTLQKKICEESFVRNERLVKELNESFDTIPQLKSPKQSENSGHSEKYKDAGPNDEFHDDHKNFTEDSLLEKTSDESFVRTERLVKELNDSVDTIPQPKSSMQSENSERFEKSDCESHDDRKYFTEDSLPEKIFVRNERSVDTIPQPKSSMQSENMGRSETSKGTDCESHDDFTEDSLLERSGSELNFNDTIEEMEYFMKQAGLKKANSDSVWENFTQTNDKREDSHCPERLEYSSPVRAIKLDAVKPFKPPQSPLKLNINRDNIKPPAQSHFKLQSASKSKTPTGAALKVHHQIDKFQSIISPIGHYIKNSPTVPMLKNVSPAKNYWNRPPPKNMHQKQLTKPVKSLAGKENAKLPEMAYKSPKITNVIDKPTVKRLPTNQNKALAIVEKLPKPLIIKHVKREKFDSKKFSEVITVEDSFACLPLKSSDVSHCIGKTATRTNTLK